MTTAFVSRTECRPDHGTSRAATMKSLARKIPDWINDPQSYQAEGPKKSYRTVFISDVHLGTSGCSASQLVDFLHSFECETLYLVGDIVDGWQIRRGWYWPSSHNDVIRSILKFARRGTRVIYIPGNHDEAFRDYVGLEFGGVEMVEEDIHETADGRRLLVLHGDKFDGVVLYAKWLAFLGDHAYTALLKANSVWNFARRKLGLPYWSLSAYAKHRVKNAVNFIGRFEETVAHAAAEHGVDGVVCGHIHTAEIRRIGDIMYYNDGDWVESCTALVEDHAGAMSLIDWRAETWEKELARANGGIAAGAAAAEAEAGRAVATA